MSLGIWKSEIDELSLLPSSYLFLFTISGVSLVLALSQVRVRKNVMTLPSIPYYTRVQEILFSVRCKAKVIKEIELPVSFPANREQSEG